MGVRGHLDGHVPAREKLELDPSDPKIVLTVGRSGYQLAEESE